MIVNADRQSVALCRWLRPVVPRWMAMIELFQWPSRGEAGVVGRRQVTIRAGTAFNRCLFFGQRRPIRFVIPAV